MAVYTHVPDPELHRFVAEYDLGTVVSCTGITEGVENSNFMLVTTAGRYILTLYEKRVNPADLPFFLDLMRHLASRGIACPQPVVARDGVALRLLCDRPAALVTFLAGQWPRNIEPSHCAQVGTALAGLQHAVADFDGQRANALSLAGWQRLVTDCTAQADTVQPGLADTIQAELAYLQRAWPHDLPQGVIHADLFPDNVFFQDGRLTGLIDFYFACRDGLAYDLAICLNAWCFDADGTYDPNKGRALLSGYEQSRPLTVAERAALPILARGAALRFLLTRLYDWLNQPPGALVRPKDPLEYLRRLRFHQQVRPINPYGDL